MSEWLKNNLPILGFFFAVMSTITTFLIYLINVQTEEVTRKHTQPIIEEINKLENKFSDINARLDMLIKNTYKTDKLKSPENVFPKIEPNKK